LLDSHPCPAPGSWWVRGDGPPGGEAARHLDRHGAGGEGRPGEAEGGEQGAVDKGIADKAFPFLKERAEYDLHCPPEGLTLVTIDVRGVDEDIPVQIRVSGCGKSAVYAATGAGWLLDSASTK